MKQTVVPRKGKGTQLFNEFNPEEEKMGKEECRVCYFLKMKVCLTADGKVKEREERMHTVWFCRRSETNCSLAALPNGVTTGYVWLFTCQVINIKYKNKISSSTAAATFQCSIDVCG